MLLSTRKGKCIRFNERHVRNVGRNSIGVRSIRLMEGDEVIDIAAVEPETTVLAITTLGYGKRTDPDEYREQGRAGMGIKAMQLTDKTGDLAALMFVHEDEDILLITDDGTIIRARAADVRLCGRSTQGVRIMRLSEGSMVVGVCRAEKEEEEPAESAENGTAEAAETAGDAENATAEVPETAANTETEQPAEPENPETPAE
jgi:DNA gyrase subunit A